MKRMPAVGVATAAAAIFLGLCAWGLWRYMAPDHLIDRIPVTQQDSWSIMLAIGLYGKEFGEAPKGGSAEIMAALIKDHPGTGPFLDSPRIRKNGGLLDPWGTPYEIEILPEGRARVSSAGANKEHGDRDDETYEDELALPTAKPPR